jgi:heat shock protein HslJ
VPRTALTLLASVLAIGALAIGGCAAAPTGRTTVPSGLIGIWIVDPASVTGVGGPSAEQADSARPYIEFTSDRTWTASDGCNEVEGTWELRADGTFVTSAGPHDLVECDGEQLPLAVTLADGVKVDGDRLVIFSSADLSTTRLVRAATVRTAPHRESPVGTWIESDTAMSPFLSISEDRTFIGNDGCNWLLGKWSFDEDGQVVFSDVAATRVFCEGVDTWLFGLELARVSSGVMTIGSADGRVLGQLIRRGVDT